MHNVTSEKFFKIISENTWEDLLNGDDEICVESGKRNTVIRLEDIVPALHLKHNSKIKHEKSLYHQLKDEYEKLPKKDNDILEFFRRYRKLKFKRYVPSVDHISFILHIAYDHRPIWRRAVLEEFKDFAPDPIIKEDNYDHIKCSQEIEDFLIYMDTLDDYLRPKDELP